MTSYALNWYWIWKTLSLSQKWVIINISKIKFRRILRDRWIICDDYRTAVSWLTKIGSHPQKWNSILPQIINVLTLKHIFKKIRSFYQKSLVDIEMMTMKIIKRDWKISNWLLQDSNKCLFHLLKSHDTQVRKVAK